MITNTRKINWDLNTDMVEKILTKQLEAKCRKLERQVKCRKCQVNQLKLFLNLLNRAGVTPDKLLTRRVRKDNTILYKGHPYSVPIGTYSPKFQVEVQVKEQYGMLMIVSFYDDQLLALHLVNQGEPPRNTELQDDPQLPLF